MGGFRPGKTLCLVRQARRLVEMIILSIFWARLGYRLGAEPTVGLGRLGGQQILYGFIGP